MSRVDKLLVLMGGVPMATVTRGARHPLLAYDPAWLSRADGGFPLSLSLPLGSPTHCGPVVSNFLWNLLPDGERTLAEWGRRFGVAANDVMGLLAHVGEDCAGAVQFVTPERLDAVREAGDVRFIDEAEIAARLARLRTSAGTSGRRPGDVGQFSLAGAQPKTALALVDGRWGVPSGRVPTTHILKPPSLAYVGHIENEHICLAAAGRLGHRVARSGVMRFGDEVAIVVKRFDRVQRGDKVFRIHQEDFVQGLGMHPDDKYELEGRGPTARDVVHRILRWTSDPKADRKAFLAALAYNYVVGGTDAHAKNYSMQFATGGQARMAPLYDIASILPYEDTSRIRMAMSVGGRFGLDEVGLREWTMEAKAAVMPQEEVFGPLRDMLARAPDAFADVARKARDDGLDSPVLDTLPAAVAARCAKLARQFGVEPAPAREEALAPTF